MELPLEVYLPAVLGRKKPVHSSTKRDSNGGREKRRKGPGENIRLVKRHNIEKRGKSKKNGKGSLHSAPRKRSARKKEGSTMPPF